MTVVDLSLAIRPPDLPGALCAQTDPEAFFPEGGGTGAAGKAICGICDERIACLEWALETREPFGIYGGLTAHQRRALQRPGRRLHHEPHSREISRETRQKFADNARRNNNRRAQEKVS